MKRPNFRNINVRKLAGVTSVVGLDVTDRRIRLAEVVVHGGTINRFRSRFSATNCFTHKFGEGETLEATVGLVREEMKRQRIRSKYAVAAVLGSAVRSVRTEIPGEAAGVDEWIQEHFDKLVKVPVARVELTTRYEILGTSGSGTLVEISFVRNSEIEKAERLAGLLGLELISLSAGVRDAVNPLLFSDTPAGGKSVMFAFGSDNTVTEFRLESGKVTGTREMDPDEFGMRTEQGGAPEENAETIAAGDFAMVRRDAFRPFGLDTEYTLAAGLALKGFLPELNPVDLLPEKTASVVSERLSSRLLQRTVIACGGLLIALLLIQFLLSLYAGSVSASVDNRMMESGINYTELAPLEKQNAMMKRELRLMESPDSRSDLAALLHKLARVTPEGVWFYRVGVSEAANGKATVLISGYATDAGRIAGFVRSCEGDAKFSDVRLLRSGLPALNENVGPVEKKIHSVFTFSISMKSAVR